jgi:hypothetical protein
VALPKIQCVYYYAKRLQGAVRVTVVANYESSVVATGPALLVTFSSCCPQTGYARRSNGGKIYHTSSYSLLAPEFGPAEQPADGI